MSETLQEQLYRAGERRLLANAEWRRYATAAMLTELKEAGKDWQQSLYYHGMYTRAMSRLSAAIAAIEAAVPPEVLAERDAALFEYSKLWYEQRDIERAANGEVEEDVTPIRPRHKG